MTPDQYTIKEYSLEVGDGHIIYAQEWGNKEAHIPIIYLHGGPGGGVDNRNKARFNPLTQRVIFFDQRGAGKSQPTGSLDNNTTNDLVEDIEKIVTKLNLKSFIITGGSWGSCLALAYTLAYPERVLGLVINGAFTGSRDELEWISQGRFKEFFPDAWVKLLEATPDKYKKDPVNYHLQNGLTGNPDSAKRSAYIYETLESSIIRLDDRVRMPMYETYDAGPIKLEMHYIANQCFLKDKFIFANAHRISCPVWIIQGRYDMVCRPIVAYNLHEELPNSHLVWTINGHLGEHEAANIINLALLSLSGNL